VKNNFAKFQIYLFQNVIIAGTSNLTAVKVCKNHLSEKGIKAMYEVIKKRRRHNFSISCQFDLFDKLVKPILLYSCEI
jgi:hypothetical protein